MKALWIWFVVVGVISLFLGFVGSCQIIGNYNKHTIWITNYYTNFVASTNSISLTNLFTATNIKMVVITNDHRIDWASTNTITDIITRVTTNE